MRLSLHLENLLRVEPLCEASVTWNLLNLEPLWIGTLGNFILYAKLLRRLETFKYGNSMWGLGKLEP